MMIVLADCRVLQQVTLPEHKREVLLVGRSSDPFDNAGIWRHLFMFYTDMVVVVVASVGSDCHFQ